MNGEEWRIAQGSAIGAAHSAQQTLCQDRFASRVMETAADGAVLIAVIADGAGSASEGQTGAEIACEFFVEQITAFLKTKNASIKSLDAEFGALWLRHFQDRIRNLARENQRISRDYASTLIGAVVGANQAFFYQIGDGGAVYSTGDAQENYRFAIEPIESEYVNITEFLTDPDAEKRLRFRLIGEKIEDLFLFSDGVTNVAVDFQTNKPHEPFLRPMIAPLRRNVSAPNDLDEKLVRFLGSDKMNEKSDDDKTLIIAARHRIE